jgi:SAM-dependent methyltransferase
MEPMRDFLRETYQRSYHNAHLTEHQARKVVWQAISRFLEPYVPADAHILEIGAGYCDWINSLPGSRKVAVDLWDRIGEFAHPDVEVIQHDLRCGLSCLGDSRFDVVLASNILEHFDLDNVLMLVEQVYLYLKKNGRFIVIQPNFYYAYRHYFDDYTHRSVFTHVSMVSLLRAKGFQIERLMPRFMPYSMRRLSFKVPAWLIMLYLKSWIKPFAGQMLIIGKKLN